MRWEAFFLNPAVVWVLIPMTAILVAGVRAMHERYCLHQERITMIENGLHPDDLDSEPAEINRETAPYPHQTV